MKLDSEAILSNFQIVYLVIPLVDFNYKYDSRIQFYVVY